MPDSYPILSIATLFMYTSLLGSLSLIAMSGIDDGRPTTPNTNKCSRPRQAVTSIKAAEAYIADFIRECDTVYARYQSGITIKNSPQRLNMTLCDDTRWRCNTGKKFEG